MIPWAPFTYRVVPGNPDASVLMARLTYDIDNNFYSWLMPLVVDPGAEWATKKEEFIQAIPSLDPGWGQGYLCHRATAFQDAT